MFRIRLGDGRMVKAGLATTSRHVIVRLIAGDRVLLRIFESDPGRGEITRKL
jgi:translation initiation factor IF-1